MLNDMKPPIGMHRIVCDQTAAWPSDSRVHCKCLRRLNNKGRKAATADAKNDLRKAAEGSAYRTTQLYRLRGQSLWREMCGDYASPMLQMQ
jgi:hypothetical protein